MANMKEDLKTAMTAGGVLGAFVGLVIYIWAAIAFIKPALLHSGHSNIAASFITLGISIGGGAELSIAVGVAVGVIKALILYALIYLPYSYCCKTTETPILPMTQQPIKAVRSALSPIPNPTLDDNSKNKTRLGLPRSTSSHSFFESEKQPVPAAGAQGVQLSVLRPPN